MNKHADVKLPPDVARSAAEGERIRAIASWYTYHPSTPTPEEWPIVKDLAR